MLEAAKLELQQTHEIINLKSWDRVALIYKHIHEEKIMCYEWEFLRRGWSTYDRFDKRLKEKANRKRSFLNSPYHQSPEMHSKLERNKKQHSTIDVKTVILHCQRFSDSIISFFLSTLSRWW